MHILTKEDSLSCIPISSVSSFNVSISGKTAVFPSVFDGQSHYPSVVPASMNTDIYHSLIKNTHDQAETTNQQLLSQGTGEYHVNGFLLKADIVWSRQQIKRDRLQ